MNYEEMARKIADMKGGVYNRNYFRLGTYAWTITKCVSKKSRDGKDMIAVEGDIAKVLAGGEQSNKEGESVSHAQTDKFDYLLKDQLAICAALLDRNVQELKEDPKSMIEALKAVFPPEGSDQESIAVGRTIRVNCVPGKKKNGDPIDRRYFDPYKG